jgi:hypothetical protein
MCSVLSQTKNTCCQVYQVVAYKQQWRGIVEDVRTYCVEAKDSILTTTVEKQQGFPTVQRQGWQDM